MQWLEFIEDNEWEGEIWTVYCPITDEDESRLCYELVDAYENCGYQLETYQISIVERDEETIDAIAEQAEREGYGYYPSYNVWDLTSGVMRNIEKAVTVLRSGNVDDEKVRKLFYKLQLFD